MGGKMINVQADCDRPARPMKTEIIMGVKPKPPSAGLVKKNTGRTRV
jgi:hypothetical protein